jgi:hypothetical protein
MMSLHIPDLGLDEKTGLLGASVKYAASGNKEADRTR